MKIHLHILIIILYPILIRKTWAWTDHHFNEVDFVEFLLSIFSEYGIFSAIIAISKRNDSILQSTEQLKLIQKFYEKNIYSIIINIADLLKAIEYYDKENDKPMHVVYLQTSEDYELFKGLTRLKNSNTFFSLVIFRSNNQTFINLCKNPRKNDFNLFFNTRMLVVCNYLSPRPLVDVYEWYSVHRNETIINRFAIWKNTKLTTISHTNLWKRRISFENIVFRVTTVKKNATSDKKEQLHGLMASLLGIIAEVANFKIDIQEPEEFYGVQDVITKKWNGVVGKLANRETDIGLGEFTLTRDRLDVIDFSDPVIIAPSKYYIKRPDENILQWSMYYQALGQTTSYVLISIILVLPPIISYIVLCRRNMYDSRKIYHSYLNIIRDCYLDVFGIFCQMPRTNISALRSIYIWLCVLAYALFIVYSAILTSHLAFFKPRLPFGTMEEFLNDGHYKLAIIKNTSYLDLLRDTEKKASDILLNENDLPTFFSQGIEMVCTEKIVLLMDDYSATSNQSNPTCEFIAIAQNSPVSMAFAFTKNNPYIHYFNYYLRILSSRGLIQYLRNIHKRRSNSIEMIYESVRLYNTVPIFLVLIMGMLLSLVVLICEKVYFFIRLHRYGFIKSRTNYWKPLIRSGNDKLSK